ncbi:hypothetical protein SKAU_G00190970 [Synaphobranchus kaupii]|uniref:Uncharacterized protein n=1 Tax=Synaphobranchus kaupii TaxID=118154 RepID=A0A9Q1IXA0_SYNKA|nr:hypothetical protein SKAU_G00190970 [Synaphobranchus kaupii]
MAACELRGELKYRDGEKKEFVVKTENNLKNILSGVQKMNADVSAVLTELVLREKGSVENGKGDIQVDDEEEDDSEEEDEKKIRDKTKASSSEPPAKRTKTLRA